MNEPPREVFLNLSLGKSNSSRRHSLHKFHESWAYLLIKTETSLLTR